MFDFSTLVFDRTLEDVIYAKSIIEKVKNRTATEQETEQYLNGLKGCYNVSDLNRVGFAVEELADILTNNVGYAVVVNPKTDWQEGDIPTVTQLTAYLENVRVLLNAIYDISTQIPTTMAFLDYIKANRIEQALYIVYEWTLRVIPNFRHSGTIFAFSGFNSLVL